jgi:antitoxin component YwqK of YwqJK toxin-antitoxin module
MMKNKILAFSIIALLTIPVAGQKIDTIFYKNECTIGSVDHFKFYRLCTKVGDTDTIKVTDYYKNGAIRMTGTYKGKDFINPIGIFIYRNKKGNMTELEIFQPKKYPEITSKYLPIPKNINSESDSLLLLVAFYDNKNIKCYGYELPKYNRIGQWIFKDRKGHVLEIESHINNMLEGPFQAYYNGKLTISGQYSYGRKNGEWTFYNSNGSVEKIIYKQGEKKNKKH